MMNFLDSNYEKFYFRYQKIFIVKELQRNNWRDVFKWKNAIVLYGVFIMTNIRIDHQTDAE